MKNWFLKFRYRGMLVVIMVFALVSVILLFETTGVNYNYNKPSLDYLPSDKVVTKAESLASVDKDTVVFWDSTFGESVVAMEEYKMILSDMKVGYRAVDLSISPFPDMSKYNKAVVLLSDLSPIGENIVDLFEWVHEGGGVQFAVTLQKEVYLASYEQALGIVDSSWSYSMVDSIHIADGFMIGGGRTYYIEQSYDSAWAVQLNPSVAQVYAWVDNESKTPLIWKTEYGKGRCVVVNIGHNEKAMRGFYSSSFSLLDDIFVYPVINSSTFYLDDLPSQIPQGSSEYVTRDFDVTVREFYVNIWWPDMMNHADKYDIKFTGLAIACYDDNVDGTTPSTPDKGTFLNFGNMLLRHGGEIGYHGYNHQPLCMDECDYEDLYDYKTWESKEAMESAFDNIVDLCDELFPGVEISQYVPPSNIMSKVGEKFLLDTYPHIKSISGIYFPDGNFKYNCTQEFDMLSDGRVYQPRIISGCDLTDYMELALVSELNFHFVNSHFTHPDDALDPDRGAILGWEELSNRFESYLMYLEEVAPDIRNFTGSESSAAVQRFVALNVSKEIKDNKLILKIGNFYDEGFFIIRFNEGDFGSVDGGKISHLTGDLYLLEAQKDTITINLK